MRMQPSSSVPFGLHISQIIQGNSWGRQSFVVIHFLLSLPSSFFALRELGIVRHIVGVVFVVESFSNLFEIMEIAQTNFLKLIL